MLAAPDVLVFDEATSMLSAHAARNLESGLRRLLRGRTIVAIAHRLHTAREADRIAVVIEGRIAELGNHTQLVARGGAYARLWSAWQGGSDAALREATKASQPRP